VQAGTRQASAGVHLSIRRTPRSRDIQPPAHTREAALPCKLTQPSGDLSCFFRLRLLLLPDAAGVPMFSYEETAYMRDEPQFLPVPPQTTPTHEASEHTSCLEQQ
jgi:hypothetical protein